MRCLTPAGTSLCFYFAAPNTVSAWAPKGQTPVIQFPFNWNHVSAIAGLTCTNCLFRLHEVSINVAVPSVIFFRFRIIH